MNKNELQNAMKDTMTLEELQSCMLEITKKIHQICEKHELRYWLSYGSLLGAIRHDGFIPWDDDMDIMMPRKDFYRFLEVAQEELGDDYFLQTPDTDHNYTILNVPVKVRDNHTTVIEEWDKNYHQGAFVDIFIMDFVGDDPSAYFKVRKKTAMLASLKMRIDFHQLAGIKKYIRILLQLLCKPIPCRTLFHYIEKQGQKFVAHDDKDSSMCATGLEHVEKDIYTLESIFPLQLHTFEDAEFYIPHDAKKLLSDAYGNYLQEPPLEERIPHGIYYGKKRFYKLPMNK